MVFFNCSVCGEAVKKNQVEKHWQFKCRSANCFECVDCGKEFWGEDYKQHIKCISEEEKYSGPNYKPKPGANKGEAKQEQWTEQVQHAIFKAKANPKLQGLLKRLVDYPNIPRKQMKFEKFLQNSVNCRDPKLCSEAWNLISAEMAASKPGSNNPQAQKNEIPAPEPAAAVPEAEPTVEAEENAQENKKKQSKRERKEERQKKASKSKKKCKKADKTDADSLEKRSKKRKNAEAEENHETKNKDKSNEAEVNENGKKKKKKKQRQEEEVDNNAGNTVAAGSNVCDEATVMKSECQFNSLPVPFPAVTEDIAKSLPTQRKKWEEPNHEELQRILLQEQIAKVRLEKEKLQLEIRMLELDGVTIHMGQQFLTEQ